MTVGIAMTHEFSLDGLAIARERIAKEAEERSGFLDLGMLGLAELPEELFRLTHLRRLNLGAGYLDEQREWQDSITDIDERNSFAGGLRRLGELAELRSLFLHGIALSSLAGVERLANLVEIDCSGTQVSDLAPLAALPGLQMIDCSGTPVNDVAPLAGLPNLKQLYCRSGG
jgi:internalin A